ncbi:MAG: hypothetical protein IKD54_06270 [Clostridia bacterium]|nr:hypothetical protein [Clostridia bacterium]
MPRTMNMVPIDAGKLRAELQKRGFDAAKASVEIGYAPSYLASMVFKESAKGKLPERALILLFERLNIRRESIEIVERAATEEPETPPRAASFDWDKLYTTIYQAVYDATLAAFN